MGGLRYQWTQVHGPHVTLVGADTARPYFQAPSVTRPTSVRFELTVHDGLGTAKDQVTVVIWPPVVVDYVVVGLNVTFTTNVAQQGHSWDFGDGGSSTSATPRHTYGARGTYNVRLTVSDGTGFNTTVNLPVVASEDRAYLSGTTPPAIGAGQGAPLLAALALVGVAGILFFLIVGKRRRRD